MPSPSALPQPTPYASDPRAHLTVKKFWLTVPQNLLLFIEDRAASERMTTQDWLEKNISEALHCYLGI
jgi:hypothetical protein